VVHRRRQTWTVIKDHHRRAASTGWRLFPFSHLRSRSDMLSCQTVAWWWVVDAVVRVLCGLPRETCWCTAHLYGAAFFCCAALLWRILLPAEGYYHGGAGGLLCLLLCGLRSILPSANLVLGWFPIWFSFRFSLRNEYKTSIQ
jgi:hypothetical protein